MNKQKIVDKWINEHGAASFDLESGDILLHDGGLFSIDKKKVKVHKVIGKKRGKDGLLEILFSKKKCKTIEQYTAVLWVTELHEMILYLQSMEKMLTKIGMNPWASYNWMKHGAKKSKRTSGRKSHR